MKTAWFVMCALVAVGCSDDAGTMALASCTGAGDAVDVSGAQVCAYELPVVIEEGFECPEGLVYRLETKGGSLCSDVRIALDDLPALFCEKDFDCEPQAELGQSCGGNAPQPLTCPERLRCCQPNPQLIDAPGSCRQPADDAQRGETCGVDSGRCCSPGLACEADGAGNGTCV